MLTVLLATFPITALVNHLWQTTVVVAIVWVLTSFLHRNRASFRFRLWLVASMKFLLPFSLLITAGQHLRPATASSAPIRTISTLLSDAVQPYQGLELPQAKEIATQPKDSAFRLRLTGLCLALWAFGTLAVSVSWLRSWASLHRAVRHATPWTIVSGVPVLQTTSLLEPGIFGMFRPVLLTPQNLLARLRTEELDAIFAHELCHVKRRDNATAALHTLVFALFWFHPAVWLIKARLLDERERACDEDVITSGKNPELYAQSILNVCRFYLEAPTMTMAGVTGGDLRQRVTRIMNLTSCTSLSAHRRVMVAALGLVVLTLPFAAGMINGRQVHAQIAQLTKTFEVVSIRPDPSVTNMSMDENQTSWNTKGAPLKLLVWAAFSLKDFQVLNAPGWMQSERYTIQARLPEEMSKLPEEERGKQIGPMLQSMLVDRFHLRYHWTTQVFPVYSLVSDKRGPKVPLAAPADQEELMVGDSTYDAHAITMGTFADNLGGNLNRIVQDRTGLMGKYTFKLTYPPETGADLASSQMDSEVRLFSALRDQLGLKLVAEKRSVTMMVIDDIQRPTPN